MGYAHHIPKTGDAQAVDALVDQQPAPDDAPNPSTRPVGLTSAATDQTGSYDLMFAPAPLGVAANASDLWATEGLDAQAIMSLWVRSRLKRSAPSSRVNGGRH
jgi:hypothetical protein